MWIDDDNQNVVNKNFKNDNTDDNDVDDAKKNVWIEKLDQF